MALATAGSGPRPGPMSIEEITAEADSLLSEYTDIIPLRFWLRSAVAIQNQAHSYERDANDEEAFKFFYRHALLVMNKLSKHPELSDAANQAAWKKARSDVNRNLNKLEILKPRVKKRYDEYMEMLARKKAEREQWQKEHRDETYATLVGGMDGLKVESPRFSRTTQLDPSKNADLALRLAQTGYGSVQQPSAASRRVEPRSAPRSTRDDRSHRGRSFLHDESDDELAQNMRAINSRHKESSVKHSHLGNQSSILNDRPSTNRAPQYPSVPKHADKQESSWYRASPGSSPSLSVRSIPFSSNAPPLARPPKERFDSSNDPPPLPDKIRTPPPLARFEAPDTSVSALNSKNYTFATSETTESGAPLRTVFLNPKLRDNFLTIALANTQRNLETCGILCGQLISNAFFISKLVIPEQESTSDTCDTVNEGALFDYCDTNNLMTLGWIHTHPTQTCFMSSRDLHTHGGYQVQLPESVAIVCAPRHMPSWGIFRLTDPPGLSAILTCKQTGIFHPHAEKNIYTTALQPGHVREVDNLPFDVVDLRPESSWI